MSRGRSGATVKLTVMENEPLARLAEQRLRHEGIRCFVRALGVGPGGWGTSVNLPHGLYVEEADEMQARQVMELPPMEIIERETSLSAPTIHRQAVITFMVLLAAAIILSSIGLALQSLLR